VKIVTIGRGRVGGGLAELWRKAGHDVTELGSEGGDASGADAALLAVPDNVIAGALGKVTGLGGVPVIDATNLFHGGRPAEFDSLAAYVKSLTGGPVAKAFNTNFAVLYGRTGEGRVRPSMVFVSDDDARGATETLVRDAGYEPAYAGDLGAARALEDSLGILFALSRERGPFFYRIGGPDEL
jgi:predicted dinucleotide-binding enzyme